MSSAAPSKGVDVVRQGGNAKAGKPAQKALREMRVEAKRPSAPAQQRGWSGRRGDGAPVRPAGGSGDRPGLPRGLLRPPGRPQPGVTQGNSPVPRPPGQGSQDVRRGVSAGEERRAAGRASPREAVRETPGAPSHHIRGSSGLWTHLNRTGLEEHSKKQAYSVERMPIPVRQK